MIREQEDPAGWTFTLRVGRGAADSVHTLTLSWVDYEHWTRGAVAPAVVAEALARVALESAAESGLGEHVDAGRLAREIPGLGERVRAALGGAG